MANSKFTRYRTMAAIFFAAFLSTANAQTVPLKASQWLVDPQLTTAATPYQDGSAIVVSFDKQVGYIVTPWTAAINGDVLTVTLTVQTEPVKATKPVRFVALASASGCVSPPAAHLYFQTADLYNDVDGTRWWSNPVAWELKDGLVTLEVELSPRNWSSTFGHGGNEMPDAFNNAKRHPTYIGLTLGGSCSFGHGVRVKKGEARLVLLDYRIR